MDNPYMTHFVNSMHVVFPEGEKFFIRSVRRFLKEVKDPDLKANIRGFCGQEGVHAKEHENFWEVMRSQNLHPDSFGELINTYYFSNKYSIENIILNGFNALSPRLGEKMNLSITAGLEHYTAIIAKAVFEEPILTNKSMAPEMLELLHWHACEEIEHKAVCFDVLQEVDDSYAIRIGGMLIASATLWSSLIIGMAYFLYQDDERNAPKQVSIGSEFVNRVILGKMGKGLANNLFKYFKKDFHPDQIEDNGILERFFKDKSYA
ncbi:MAG: metal-dependent hydrolase [Chitinophagales bacterium]|nr:metal-dependent hydrolase [Chitinophagales bacterium]